MREGETLRSFASARRRSATAIGGRVVITLALCTRVHFFLLVFALTSAVYRVARLRATVYTPPRCTRCRGSPRGSLKLDGFGR